MKLHNRFTRVQRFKETPAVKVIAPWLFCLLVLLSGSVHAEVSIIPKPQQRVAGEGSFTLNASTQIAAPEDKRLQEIAAFLRDAIAQQTGIVASGKSSAASRIALRLNPEVQGDEAYRMIVAPRLVTIEAASDKGLFWGVQTLRQLLPQKKASTASIAAVRIEDAPQFGYRGQMLDVGRHFFPVDFIKKHIDLLSYYKINVFRWHLTEDQGWRIEIKRYPKLTEVGAWRTEADGSRYGGFYTQDQIKDVVEYARLRNIMVIPEIEMPGHASAALASYPELSCRKQPVEIPATWGVFKDVFCVGDEFTFTFLQGVLDEVIALFPAPYLHIGGDEAPKDRWKESASSQQRMRDEGLKDEHGLQSYFVKRIQRYLASKNRTLIGWDEILEGGADKTAIVEVWRGEEEGAKALANGNRIINAGSFYFDSSLKELTLEQIYRTEIVAPSYVGQRELVLGAEAPLWTERITALNAEAMLYPRMLAFSELLWSSGGRDYDDFKQRLQAHYRQLDAWQVAYGPEDTDVVEYRVVPDPEHRRWQLRVQRGWPDLQVRYTLDGTEPTSDSPAFTDSLDIRSPGVVKVAPFRAARQYQPAQSFTLADSKAFGKPIRYANPIDKRYQAAGSSALVDGMVGSDEFRDGVWVGWQGADLDATIDLQQSTEFQTISVRFMQQSAPWILLPRSVSFSISPDGESWTPLQTNRVDVDPDNRRAFAREFNYSATKPITTRYIRVHAAKYGTLPPKHGDAGKQAWLFADEIIVR